MATADDLLAAFKERDAARVRDLVAAQPSLARARFADGTCALMTALFWRFTEAADALRGAHGPLDLDEALVLDLPAAAELLKAHPEQAQGHFANGWTPMHLPPFFGSVEAAELLAKHGAPIALRSTNYMGNTPLHTCGFSGAHRVAQWLLDHGAPVDADSEGGFTPLHIAAGNGQIAVVRVLLKAGARRDAKAKDGTTPLDQAEKNDEAEVAALLEAEGASTAPP